MEFKVYKLKQEFHSICDWREYKISINEQRPGLLLVLEDEQFPDSLCCIPISKDDDKHNKYKQLMISKPTNVHPIKMNQYDNYLLIQNMFYVRKEFIGDPFTVKQIHIEIKNSAEREVIMKKVKKMNALIKSGKLPYFVPRKEVHDIQISYLENKRYGSLDIQKEIHITLNNS
ncbi:hypothetical protein MKY66_28165 [Paenibacillus sp. FSL R5-0766]|uniref:hypothetical protein n=1 Tax=unclassified Paenibacillus TaxID=185978 RepID=UPI00096FA86B|nr:hypothetical protein [Paenibacillus sp. FSL R5-0765]OMF66417.1 hypothetical protein BK141_05745 [Paenibacillus sp. FSL R5-0765]